MIVRKIKPNETYFLADMLYEALFVPEGLEALPRDVIRETSLSKYIDNWGKDVYDVALVSLVDEQLVGAVWGRLMASENKGFGYVDDDTPELSMAVRPAYRNQGIGTQLLRAIAAEYAPMGVRQLSLSVDKANEAAKLYAKLGYEVVYETATSLTMKKEIA